MDVFKKRIGFYAGVLLLSSTMSFAGCLFALFTINPPFEWTTLSEYIAYCQTYDQSLKHIAQASMIVLIVSLLVAIAVIDDMVQTEKKLFSKFSFIFIAISATLISMGYFVQLTAVRWHFASGTADGLAHFVQFYPHSATLAIIMLGYTLFLGLSSVTILPALNSLAPIRGLKTGFAINAVACGLSLVGFLFQIIPLILFATNIGNGIAFLIIGAGLLRCFGKKG